MLRLVPIGLAAGFFSALFGVGGGIIMVPLLVLGVRYREHHAAATALAGVVGYSFTDRVRPAEALLVGIPAAVGAVAGASLQQRIPRRELSLLFAALLIVIAALLVLS